MLIFTCAPLHHTHKVQITLLCQPSISHMTCVWQILPQKRFISEKCAAWGVFLDKYLTGHFKYLYICLCLYTMYSSWVMVVQRTKREMILAGKRCWHSLETGMMLCSEDTSTNNLRQNVLSLLREYLMCVPDVIYLKRQTVCAKPSGTGVVLSGASWCSPSGWHSENCRRAHPGKTTRKYQHDKALAHGNCAPLG